MLCDRPIGRDIMAAGFYGDSAVFSQSQPRLHERQRAAASGALFNVCSLAEDGQYCIVLTTNRMPAHTKVKSPEGQDVRTPDIFDIGRRCKTIGNRYREIFGGAG